MEKNILLIVLVAGIAAIAIFIAVVLFPVLQGQAECIIPSGAIVSKNIYPGTFTSFEATGPVEVFFKQDKTESVRIEANENIADLVNAGVEENTLKIFFGRAAIDLRPVCNDFVTTIIFISAPVLESILASNSATVFVKDQMLSEKLLVKATNSARLEANVSIGILGSFASNSAIIVLKGFAEEHTAQAVSGGQILASELFTKTAVLDAEDAGIVEATVLDKVEVSAITGGTVGFRGTPIIISSSTSSGGTITEIPSYASDTGNNTGSAGVDDVDGAIRTRMINILSHGNYSLFEPIEMVEENKKHFHDILKSFMNKYSFNPKLFPEDKSQPTQSRPT